jgi:hypothetical protein
MTSVDRPRVVILGGSFDALAIRQQILSAFEAAEVCDDPDPNLINPWGVAFSPKSPFWVNNNHTGTATIYNVDPTTDATKAASLVVAIAPPTGRYNGQPDGHCVQPRSQRIDAERQRKAQLARH